MSLKCPLLAKLLMAAFAWVHLSEIDVLANETRPNFVFILSDDLAQGDVGCYGQKLIQTPHMDRLANEGTMFTQAYCGTTVCAPSRASLMTGLHSGHCPIRANWEIKPGEGQFPLPAETVTVAEILQAAGYATACCGKWGMGMFDTSGSPLKQGFDHFYGYNCQRHAHSYFPTHLYDNDQQFSLPGNSGKGSTATYSQELIQRDAERWLKQQQGNPFFLFYAVTLPHGRHEIDNLGQYADKDWTPKQKAYAAQVSRLDSDIGRIISILHEMGVADNTLVIVAGDNGSSFSPQSELGRHFDQTMGGKLRGFKRSLYEGGLRQAAIAWWPDIVPAGRVCKQPWAFWDFLPTVADLAGVVLPSECQPDGVSLAKLLAGGPAPQREYFYWELHEGPFLQAVRFDHWKAVRNGINKPMELYDLSVDLGEQNNVAASHRDVVKRAKQLMQVAHQDDLNWPIFANSKQRNAWRKNRP